MTLVRPDPGALMIFAAGFGTRMGALTTSTPKPLLRLGGKTLLDRALALGLAAGIPRIVVNAHYLSDQIVAATAGRDIDVSVEHPHILDTGGGLRRALPLLRSRIVYTLNPDALFLGENPLACLADAWPSTRPAALLLLVPFDRAEMRKGGGDFSIGQDGRLTRGGDLVYTGAQIIDTEVLHRIDADAFSLNRCWDLLVEEGELHGVVYPGAWCDLGTPGALAHAEKLLADENA